jgi:hypothetical protein
MRMGGTLPGALRRGQLTAVLGRARLLDSPVTAIRRL